MTPPPTASKTDPAPGVARVTSVSLDQDLLLNGAVLAGCWLLVFNQLRVDWSINPQYYYGWVVPLLAFFSLQTRWTTKPAAAPPRQAGRLLLGLGLILALFLPIRLIEEANPEWRLILWLHALQMVVISLGALYYCGGWGWVRQCAFPLLFLLVAVPWPVELEHLVIQGLMRDIAAITSETAGWLGIPAVQYGNLIQISTGMVGIDEACSGVRSLQTTLFVSLFLGELYQFKAGRRSLLLFLGLLIALLGNLGRTTFLVWTAAHQGLPGMHRVHDAAGMWALVFTLVTLWVLANLLRRGAVLPQAVSVPSSVARYFPRPVVLGAAAWLVTVEVANEAWYRAHESHITANLHWTLNWPVSESRFTDVPIDDGVRSMLRFSSGRAVTWEDNSANLWQLFFFRWEPGRNSAQLATTHTPDICLTAAGFERTEDRGVQLISAAGLKLPVRESVFVRNGEPLYVFYCLWEDHPDQTEDALLKSGVFTLRSRFTAILAGHRHLGQQVLEVALQGPADMQEASRLYAAEMQKLIQR